MKQPYLSELIAKLEKLRDAYIAKHGIEPVIWSWEDDLDGLELCAKIKKTPYGALTSERPYMNRRIKKP